jgi:hypothetical protein
VLDRSRDTSELRGNFVMTHALHSVDSHDAQLRVVGAGEQMPALFGDLGGLFGRGLAAEGAFQNRLVRRVCRTEERRFPVELAAAPFLGAIVGRLVSDLPLRDQDEQRPEIAASVEMGELAAPGIPAEAGQRAKGDVRFVGNSPGRTAEPLAGLLR